MPPRSSSLDAIALPPFETKDLRENLTRFLNTPFSDPVTGSSMPIGDYRWGIYAFFDYDDEPIYVGQTNEKLRTRIRRHLTNQRTDAVAMSVLDPFEVFEIEVWPLPQFQNVGQGASKRDAKLHLDALERAVYASALDKSKFRAILNEKDPPTGSLAIALPGSFRQRIVGEEVQRIRSHPDFRLARRALIMSRLAQVISERKVQGGLRRVLLTQAKRLERLAQRRYDAMGGAGSVITEDEPEDEE